MIMEIGMLVFPESCQPVEAILEELRHNLQLIYTSLTATLVNGYGLVACGSGEISRMLSQLVIYHVLLR